MKPVAWNIKENRPPYSSDNPNDIVALYTAPRELSDEEIHEVSKLKDVWIEQEDGSIKLSPYKFARAILKKASEK